MADGIRFQILKAMNDYICNVVGDEEIWYIWITGGVEDGADDDIIREYANDVEIFNACVKLFARLID